MDYSQAGQGAPVDDAAAARRRRGIRRRAAQPARVHPARHDRRPVDGLDQHRHRRLRWHATPSGQCRAPAAAASGASALPAGASAVTGGMIRVAVQRPVSVDPVAMQDLGGYGITAAVVRVPVHRRHATRPRPIAPGLADRVGAERRRDRLDVQAPPGRQVARRHGVHVGRRRRDDGAPGRRRQLRPEGRPRGRAARSRPTPNTVTFTLLGANGNFPYLVSVFNAQTLITPVDYAAGHDVRQGPGRNGRLEARDATTSRPAPRSSATRTGGAARRRSTALEFIFFDETGPMVTAYQGGQVDAIVQFDVLSGSAAPRRRELQPDRRARGAPSPDLDAHRHGRVRRQARPPGARPDVRPPGAHPAAVPGQGRARQRPRHLAGLPVLRLRRSPQRDPGHRQGQGSSLPTPGPAA